MLWKPLTTTITVICFTAYTVFLPTMALADPPSVAPDTPSIVTLKLGDPAPFDGTLFNTKAAAKLLIDLEYSSSTCKLEKDRELGILRSNLQLKIDLCYASRDAQKFRFDETLKIRNGQISFLESQLRPAPWYESGEFWFAVGLLGGVLITVGAGYAIGQVSK
jgi:hypothetical protein